MVRWPQIIINGFGNKMMKCRKSLILLDRFRFEQQLFSYIQKSMNRLAKSGQGISRGGSRGISNAHMKTSLQTHNSSIRKNGAQHTSIVNSQKPSYKYNPNTYDYSQTPLRNLLRDKNPNVFETHHDDLDSKKDQKKDFRIRNNNVMSSSRKTDKDEEERDKERERQREREQQRERQKERQRQRERERQRQRQRERERERERQREREKEKEKERQKQRQAILKKQQLEIEQIQRSKMSDGSNSTLERIQSKLMTHQKKADSILSMNNEKKPSYSFSTSKKLGLVGLNNIGNTCFMNSILQCMFNLPEFNEYFLENSHLAEMKSNARVAETYARTIKMMRSSTNNSQTPSDLKSAIGSKRSRFLGYAQQDAQQFLAALLELLSIDLNRAKNPKYKELTADTSKNSLKQIVKYFFILSDEWWNYNRQREDSVVCDFFSGQVLSRVVCSRCGYESIGFDNIWDMALNFTSRDEGDILKMVQNFLKEEVISNDYFCSKCKTFRECRRKIDIYRLPRILVFQIKRFSYGHWRKTKLNNRVKVETVLDLSQVIYKSDHPSVKNPIYELVGVVNHSGGIDFGHYTAECKNPINGKWYNFNDSSVHETRISNDFESSSPYVLFYAKRSP